MPGSHIIYVRHCDTRTFFFAVDERTHGISFYPRQSSLCTIVHNNIYIYLFFF